MTNNRWIWVSALVAVASLLLIGARLILGRFVPDREHPNPWVVIPRRTLDALLVPEETSVTIRLSKPLPLSNGGSEWGKTSSGMVSAVTPTSVVYKAQKGLAGFDDGNDDISYTNGNQQLVVWVKVVTREAYRDQALGTPIGTTPIAVNDKSTQGCVLPLGRDSNLDVTAYIAPNEMPLGTCKKYLVELRPHNPIPGSDGSPPFSGR